MKQLVCIALCTVFLVFFLALAAGALFPLAEVNTETPEDAVPIAPSPTKDFSDETASPDVTACTPCDETILLQVQTEVGIETMNMHDYLVGVISAEMPASFELQALRAQAVAARTYTLYRRDISPSPNHPEADVCTDTLCCKAYLSARQLQERWGESYEEYFEKMESAVSDTDGIAVFYENEPILAAFHSSSGSMTEDAANVWGGSLPYLVPVSTPETEADVNRFFQSVTMSWQEFAGAIWDSTGGTEPLPLCDGTLLAVEYTPSGRIRALRLGQQTIEGTALRSLFSLRSAAIDISLDGENVTLTTTGYGHGVGLSQYGANCMARQGKTCEEILRWYYTGAELGSVQSYIDSLS